MKKIIEYPQPGGLTFWNSEVPDRDFGVREFTHRFPTTMGEIFDRNG